MAKESVVPDKPNTSMPDLMWARISKMTRAEFSTEGDIPECTWLLIQKVKDLENRLTRADRVIYNLLYHEHRADGKIVVPLEKA